MSPTSICCRTRERARECVLWSVSRLTRQRQYQREAWVRMRPPSTEYLPGVLTSQAAGPTLNCKRGPARQAESAVALRHAGQLCTCTCTCTSTSTASQPRCTRGRASLRLRPHTQQGAHIFLPDGHVKTIISPSTCPRRPCQPDDAGWP